LLLLFSKWLLFDAGRQRLPVMRRVMRQRGLRRVAASIWMPGKTRVRR